MRKSLSALFFCFAFFVSYGQNLDNEKQYILGGFFSLANSTSLDKFERISDQDLIRNDSTSFKSFAISTQPYLGKKIGKNSLIGCGVIFSHFARQTNRNDTNGKDYYQSTNYSFGLDLFYRHNFIHTEKFNSFIQPSASFITSFGKVERIVPTLIENKSNTYKMNLNVGGLYKLNKNWNILLSIPLLEYTHRKYREANIDEATIINNFTISPILDNIQFGIERQF